jgi:hypothetical protein
MPVPRGLWFVQRGERNGGLLEGPRPPVCRLRLLSRDLDVSPRVCFQ